MQHNTGRIFCKGQVEMITIRPADERGAADHGPIRSRHSFSFGHYHDPQHMGISHLRVLNDDAVDPGAGFPPHGHRDMEIISYVTAGAMTHEDSLGNRFTIEAGQFQWMNAGRGIQHSEFNASIRRELRFLQIWILPERSGLEPAYAPPLTPAAGHEWQVVAARDHDGVLPLRQDARLLLGRFETGRQVHMPIRAGRLAYIHVVRGALELDGHTLVAGDAATIRDAGSYPVAIADASEALLFDLAG